MVYRRFSLNILLRAGLLFASLCALAFSLLSTHWIVTPIILVALCLLILADLVRYVQKTNRDLSSLFNSIHQKDFSGNFTSGDRGPSFRALQGSLNQVISDFRSLRAEKEIHHQYLQTVIEHVAVALICLDENQEVILMNQAAQNMLHRPYMKNIEALGRTHPRLLSAITTLSSGEKDLIKIAMEDKLLHLAVHATEFKLQNLNPLPPGASPTGDNAVPNGEKSYKLISLQNIKTELEENEVEAWQKLIRVLTHEIMNSVTPIISLSAMINQMLVQAAEAEDPLDGNPEKFGKLSGEEVEDMRSGLKTIESRSKGLLDFVQSYRRLTRVPNPTFEEISVRDLLNQVYTLLKPDLDTGGIQFQIVMPDPSLCIQADRALLEQVLINLVKNASEALSNQPDGLIEMIATRAPQTGLGRSPEENSLPPTKIHIQVRDNGPGIEDEFLDKIFIPFFTTKKNGSGIGLSLSRQIMRMHKGSISLHSVKGKGTIFTLEF